MKDLHSWIQPLDPPFISTLRLIELVDLLLKDVENAVRRVAVLELSSKRVREKIIFRPFFVRIQGIIENNLEVGG